MNGVVDCINASHYWSLDNVNTMFPDVSDGASAPFSKVVRDASAQCKRFIRCLGPIKCHAKRKRVETPGTGSE